MDKYEILDAYAENLSSAVRRESYLSIARQFLDFAPGPGRRYIDAYIGHLQKRGFKSGTVNLHFRVIRRLYAVNNKRWPFKRGEAPVIKELDEYRPQLSYEIIEGMVAAAKAGCLYPGQRTFLALSTIYGMRREEMSNIEAKDVNLRRSSLYVATLKEGRQQYHHIPPEIKPILANHDFNEFYCVGTLTRVFRRILVMSGYRELKGVPMGWHAIRRALTVGLVNAGVPMLAVKAFLRWKSGTDKMEIPARCFGNVVITTNEAEPVLKTAKGDEEIFEKHPFLPFWRDDG